MNNTHSKKQYKSEESFYNATVFCTVIGESKTMQKARNPAVQTTVKLLPLLFKASKFYTACNDNDGNDFVRGSDIPSRLVALWSPL